MSLCDDSGIEFARGLCNFASDELLQIKAEMLRTKAEGGDMSFFSNTEEVVHNANLALLANSELDETDDD